MLFTDSCLESKILTESVVRAQGIFKPIAGANLPTRAVSIETGVKRSAAKTHAYATNKPGLGRLLPCACASTDPHTSTQANNCFFIFCPFVQNSLKLSLVERNSLPSSSLFVKELLAQRPRCKGRHCIIDSTNVLRCCAATTTHDVDQPLGRKFAHQAGGYIRGFVKAGV